MTSRSLFALSAAAAFAALVGAPAAAAPGDRQYTAVENHDPRAFDRAVRAGADFVNGGRGRQFQLILASRGVLLVVPGTSIVQRDFLRIKSRAPGLTVIACRETLDALAQANRRRVPVIRGVTVQSCAGLRNRLGIQGWQMAPGI